MSGMHYRKLQDKFKDFSNPNFGLFYYKFAPDVEQKDGEKENRKLEFLKNLLVFNQSIKGSVEKDSDEKGWIKKRTDVLRSLPGVKAFELTNTTPFLCGVGYQGVLEWGFNFDWTTGVPYLPGSSFKGALLSYLEFLKAGKPNKGESPPAGDQMGKTASAGEEKNAKTSSDDDRLAVCKPVEKWENDNDSVALVDEKIKFSKKDILSIFGPQGKSISHPSQGNVIFYDVYPTEFTGFEIQVITPHYTPYYTDPQKPPADIYSPVPNFFLAIKPKSTFLFAFKIIERPDQPVDAEKLTKLIIETGKNYGFGAKTSSGFGFFEKSPE